MSAETNTAGISQSWDAASYGHHAAFVPDLGASLLDWLVPTAADRILDLGCGDGALTRKLADSGAQVTGIDASPSQVQAARALGLDAHVGDGESLTYDAEFDAVFSNAALHWMKQPEKVIAGVWRALKPGGRFVAEMGGFGNVARIRTALRTHIADYVDPDQVDPWYFPKLGQQAALLERAGFLVTNAQLFPRPTPLPTAMTGWLTIFGQSFLNAVPVSARDGVVARVLADLKAALQDSDGQWRADYVRLRFRAEKPLMADSGVKAVRP